MSQYAQRRRQRLDEALAAVSERIEQLATELEGLGGLGLTEEQIEERRREIADETVAGIRLRGQIAVEVDQLNTVGARLFSDRMYELALVSRLAPLRPPEGSTGLLTELEADPALVALARAPALSSAAATAMVQVVENVALSGRQLSLNDLPALRDAAGGDEPLTELAGVAHGLWLIPTDEERPYLERDVAVMLPVRIETLFKQPYLPNDATWEIWIRIVPDEASVCRDDPTPKPVEVAQLEAMWQAIVPDLSAAERVRPVDEWLDTARGRSEWERLCSRVGPERATWLVAACPPVLNADTVTVDAPNAGTETRPNRIGGFPPRLEVWVAFGSDDPAVIDTIEVDVKALVFDVIGARPAGPETTELVHEKDRWWVSWPTALDVGLGRIIPMPNGRSPADIRTLYVVGLGDEHPAEHFRAQIDAGEMAILPLGVPTNAVDDQQAASLGHGAEEWRGAARARLRQRQTGLIDETELSRSLAGPGSGLPTMPAPAEPFGLDAVLVQTLWPALWGHQIRDVWGCLEEADLLADWARRNFRPDGPLPPIRIDQQPYGLLPVTALKEWKVAAEEGPQAWHEERFVPVLTAMRRHWAGAARQQGTAVGADTATLIDLIGRDGLSASYLHRPFLAAELWAALYASVGGFDQQDYDDWIRATFDPVYTFAQREPEDPPGVRHHVAGGSADDLTIPLVVPRRWPYWYYEDEETGAIVLDEAGNPVPAMSVERGFARLLETLLEHGFRYDRVMELWRNVLPDSLLIRLLLHAGVLSAAAVVQENIGGPAPLREPLVTDAQTPTLLEQLSEQYSPNLSHDHLAGEIRISIIEGLEALLNLVRVESPDIKPLPHLERAFRAVLDTATYRIDPWIVGLAGRRLEYLRNRPESRFRLGIYGWVDGPIRGTPGPTEGGLIHAPSYPQALTAAVLRDKDISERLEAAPGHERWSMQLESERIRLAAELAEEVRLGAHIYEALGRQVERIVGVRTPVGLVVEATSRVDMLRTTYPMKPGQSDRGRVCHGKDALAGLLDGGSPPIAITSEQRAELEQVRDVLDTYGDLLIAEAVHQIVSGHADRAGAAMDAAAGLGPPPGLAFVETPLAGESLTSAVISAIPYRSSVDLTAVPDAATAPARLADASVATALVELLGSAETWTWSGPLGGNGGIRTTTLAELGLEPADTLVLAPDLLDELARTALDLGDGVALAGTGRHRHAVARDLTRALGSQPAFLRDVATTPAGGVTEVQALDVESLEELRRRYVALRATADLLAADLKSASETGNTARLREVLFRALRWGVTPLSERGGLRTLCAFLTRDVVPDDLGELAVLAQRAEEALRDRLAAAPADTSEPIARAIAELAAPEGQLAVLSRMPASALARISRLAVDAPDAELDAEWLTVVAMVRPRLAAVEALQLEAEFGGGGAPNIPGFLAWSSAPGDPWQTAALAALRDRLRRPGGTNPRPVMPRFVAAYTTGDVWHGAADDGEPRIAAGLVDSWSEAAPNVEQRTTAVFGFNAPASRPPQAILLAVPPDLAAGPGAQLDTVGLIGILEETRELAHARAVRADRLGQYLAAVPTAVFGASGQTGVRLDSGTSYVP